MLSSCSLRFGLVATTTVALALLVATQTAYPQVTVTQTNHLIATDGAAQDQAGVSVALSGNVALMGAWQDDIGPNADQGSAYLFDVTTGQQLFKLTAADGASTDQFGFSVALSGNNALVSSHLTDIGGNGDQGSAYLFNTTTGQQLNKLIASDGAADDHLGYHALALSGNTALIGALDANIGSNDDQGSAYLFNTTTGQQLLKLNAADGGAKDKFGVSVALSGTSALVGAYQSENGGAGSAYLFNATTGSQISKLTASDGASGDQFGISVALSGNLALVGAYQKDIGGNAKQGAAYLFDITTGQQLFRFTASDGAAFDNFGGSVALSGNFAVIGAGAADVNGNPDQGAAYVFDITTGQQVAKFFAADGAPNDRFGWSVALSGNTAVVGSIADTVGGTPNQGSAYTFRLAVVPEPASLSLILPAAGMAAIIHRRRRKSLSARRLLA